MISKKLATTLGTGALGASGAAGVAAWKAGLFDKPQNEVSSNPSPSQKGPESVPENKAEIERQASGTKTYFADATAYDKKAVDSSNWKRESATNDGGITIKIDESDGNSWQCTIKGFIFDNSKNKSQIDEQVNRLVEEIKSNEDKRNKFVKNCAKARLNKEKGADKGKESTIELEVEEVDGNLKLKDLDNLMTSDFTGLKRFEKDYQADHNDAEDNWFKVELEDKKVVVKMFGASNDLICSVYGEFGETNFKDDDFDLGALNTVFAGNTYTGSVDESVSLANFEKRKFFNRNCSKYNGKIYGMEVVPCADVADKKWKFKNLEELFTKMYKNPTVENHNKAQK